MKPIEAAADVPKIAPRGRRLFTARQANAALVLVRKVVRDIVKHHADLMSLRDEIEALGEAVGSQERVAELRNRGRRLATTLNQLHDELVEIGCELKDWTVGLVDFPAMHEGREVLLCWRLDEDSVRYWHDLEGGFVGRRAIDDDF